MVTLYNDDCLNILPSIEQGSIDLILCDLPYGTIADKTRATWDGDLDYDKLFFEYRRIVSTSGAIVLFGNEPFSTIVRYKLFDLYKYDIKWVKSNTTGFMNANYRPMNKYEDIMIFSKANASSGGKNNSMTYNPQGIVEVNKEKKNSSNRYGIVGEDTNNLGSKNSLLQDGTEYTQKYTNYPCNVVFFDSPKKYYHPTQKPVELLEYLIKTYSNESGVVLDSCMGSGSTGVACINTGRGFIGIELEEKYFNTAKERIENTKPVTELW